jgi:hypothetical protein
MLIVSGSSQNFQDGDVSNQLTDGGMKGKSVGGDSAFTVLCARYISLHKSFSPKNETYKYDGTDSSLWYSMQTIQLNNIKFNKDTKSLGSESITSVFSWTFDQLNNGVVTKLTKYLKYYYC